MQTLVPVAYLLVVCSRCASGDRFDTQHVLVEDSLGSSESQVNPHAVASNGLLQTAKSKLSTAELNETKAHEQPKRANATADSASDSSSETTEVKTGMSDYSVKICLGLVIATLLCVSACCCHSSFYSKVQFDPAMERLDAMSYTYDGFLGWECCILVSHTVWDNVAVERCVKRLLAVTFGVALMEMIVATDASRLDPLRFSQIGTVLQLFVGLLLGFFLSSSVARWYSCVNGLLELFEAIRNLQMQLHALGVSQTRIDLVMRYGVVSAWLLCYQLSRDVRKDYEIQVSSSARSLHETDQVQNDDGISPVSAQMVDDLERAFAELAKRHEGYFHLRAEEQALLEQVEDPATQMWMWVGSLVGRMAQDGEIPPMASPTYGRIIQLVQTAQESMKQVRQIKMVQLPYVYAHMLAMIVHLNNMLCAICYGLTVGACTASIMAHVDSRLTFHRVTPLPEHILIADAQMLLTQFFRCFFAPVLYQAFLEIGICMSNPFGNEDAAIPTDRLLAELQSDLHDSNQIAGNPPMWEKPSFKRPAA